MVKKEKKPDENIGIRNVMCVVREALKPKTTPEEDAAAIFYKMGFSEQQMIDILLAMEDRAINESVRRRIQAAYKDQQSKMEKVRPLEM